MAKRYYEVDPNWKGHATYHLGKYPRYHEDESYFNILQKYAKEGNIIAALGDIGDLEFLSTRNISILDVSNIPDYVLIGLRSNQINFQLNIISTIQISEKST